MVGMTANDLAGKRLHVIPSVLAGKLSDVFGLIFFPLLLAAIARLAGVGVGLRGIGVAVLATGAAFASVKVSQSAAASYESLIETLVFWRDADVSVIADPTDLIALPALALAFADARRALRGGR